MDDLIMLDVDDDFAPVDNQKIENNKPEIIELSSIINEPIKEDKIIGLDRLFNEDEEVIDVYEENLEKEKIRQKKIGRIQIGLIIFLVVAATLIYFFGYDFFEPYIKID